MSKNMRWKHNALGTKWRFETYTRGDQSAIVSSRSSMQILKVVTWTTTLYLPVSLWISVTYSPQRQSTTNGATGLKHENGLYDMTVRDSDFKFITHYEWNNEVIGFHDDGKDQYKWSSNFNVELVHITKNFVSGPNCEWSIALWLGFKCMSGTLRSSRKGARKWLTIFVHWVQMSGLASCWLGARWFWRRHVSTVV